MRLQNKVALVTGGGSGFGEGIVKRFVAEGAKVVVADVDEAGAQRVAGEAGDAAVAMRCDVGDAADVAALADKIGETFGHCDILVNNAGVTHLPAPLETVSTEDYERIAAVNMRAIFLTTQVFVPKMKAAGEGVILNIASTAGVSPRPNLTWYNASKGWAITATRSMAVELAPFGIRANAINPVAGETPLLKSFMGQDTPEIRAKFLSTIPLGRFSTADDIANAALYLCSDEANMVTGVCMEVDGGRCI